MEKNQNSQPSATELIRILCIKIGKYQDTPKIQFIRKYILKRKIFNLFNQFLNKDIFEQSDSLSSMIISLFAKNPDIITDDLHELIRVTTVSVEFYLSKATITYIPSDGRFEVDAFLNATDGNIKFSYYNNLNTPERLLTVWGSLEQYLETAYLRVIYCIADVLNNPMVNKEMSADEMRIDPFMN